MSELRFHISRSNQDFGELSTSEIKAMLSSGDLSMTDYAFDVQKKDWVFLLEIPQLNSALKTDKPTRKPSQIPVSGNLISLQTRQSEVSKERAEKNSGKKPPAQSAVDEDRQWYVLKGESQLGPIAYSDVVRMLQQKLAFEYELVWHPSLMQWTRIAEVEVFSKKSIKNWLSGNTQGKEIIFDRKSERWAFHAEVLAHDNTALWPGQAQQLSKFGAGVELKNGLLLPGAQVNLHFSATEELPAFNVRAEIVNKRYTPIKSKSTPVIYGFRFLNLAPAIAKKLEEKNENVAALAA